MGDEAKLEIACDSGCLEKIREFVRARASEDGFNRSDVGRLVLAVDEASSNIIEHSYQFDPKKKNLIVWQSTAEQAVVRIKDQSPVPYLPSTIDFDLPTKVKYRHFGGYGKYLIRALVDDLFFETIPGSHNEISLVKYKAPGKEKKLERQEMNPFEVAKLRSISLMNLLDVGINLVQQRTPEEVVALFLNGIMGTLSSHPVVLMAPSPDDKTFEVIGQVGLSKKNVGSEVSLERRGWIMEALWAYRGPLLIDYLRKNKAPPAELEVCEKLRSAVLLPVFVLDHLYGLVSLGAKRNRQPFSDEDMRIVTLLANQTLLLLDRRQGEQKKFGESAKSGANLKNAVLWASGELAKILRVSDPITLDLQAPDLFLKVAEERLQALLLKIMTHVRYLVNDGKVPSLTVKEENGQASIVFYYEGSPLSFKKGDEGYNPLIDQMVSGGVKLADCPRLIESEGGRIESGEKGGGVVVTIRLPLSL
jgi:serine/threonine-protein kinase RsbW